MDATIIRSFRESYFHVSCRRHMLGTLTWQWSGIGDASQSGKMVTLLYKIFFVFKTFRFCLTTVSNIMIILQSGAMGGGV